jgi:hypothetical protein
LGRWTFILISSNITIRNVALERKTWKSGFQEVSLGRSSVVSKRLFTPCVKKIRLDLKERFSIRLVWGILLGLVFGVLIAKNIITAIGFFVKRGD